MILYLDTETRAKVNLFTAGTKRYVRCPHFQVILVTYAIDDGPAKEWEPVSTLGRNVPPPTDLLEAILDDKVTIVIHESSFDREVINHTGLFGEGVTIPTHRIHDTAVQARAHGLPGSLGTLSAIFGLGEDVGKIADGKRLINIFCKPIIKMTPTDFRNKLTNPEDWEKFVQYGRQDITAMREVHKRLPTLNYPELEYDLWLIDQRIQDRGLPVDIELAEAAIVEAEKERKRLRREVRELTDNEVESSTKTAALIKHIAETYDILLPNMQAATLTRRLEDPDLPTPLRQLIENRLSASLSAATKYRPLVNQHVDGRLHNTLVFYGASRTGRDSGRSFQPQNLLRPTAPWRKLSGKAQEQAIEVDISTIKSGTIGLLSDDVMGVLGSCVRSAIRASEGKKLAVADLSNIEGRGLVWLSGEDWKLDYFRSFDRGEVAFDNYVMAYSKAMSVAPQDVNDDMRNIGKVMELGLGYGGGVAAFITFANVYRLDLTELSNSVWDVGEYSTLLDCSDKYAWAKENGYHAGLEQREYAACEYLKQQWREAHPKTVVFWRELENAYRHCIDVPNSTVYVGAQRLAFRRVGQWLFVRLPSGRVLSYLNPTIDEDGNCTFYGMSQKTQRFERIKTYSGKLAENVTSAAARDVLMHRMPAIEDDGFEIILRVHDEIVSEVCEHREDAYLALAAHMATPHEWCKDLPLAAAGFETKIYRRE